MMSIAYNAGKAKGGFMHRFLENSMYAARWILGPIYFGLSIVLFLIAVKFFHDLVVHVPQILMMSDSDVILLSLSLIDLALVGGLLVMVMFAGYENYVARFDVSDDKKGLSWLGRVDSGRLKVNVASAIIAISSIHLLKIFMNIESTPNDKLMWYTLIHLVFVASAFGVALLDRIVKSTKQVDRNYSKEVESH